MPPPERPLPCPFSAGDSRPGFAVPPGTCDCHMHFFSDAAKPVPGAVVTPPEATLAHYRRLQARLGTSRYVIVQPSTYGLDNRLVLAALAASGGNARGIAVVDDRVAPGTLARMHEAGVRGVRFNLVQHGATTAAMLEPVAQAIAPLGWHVQIHVPQSDLIALAPRLHKLGVPVVIDHLGRLMEHPELAPQTFDCIRQLLGSGTGWLKLSGAYIAARHGRYEGLDPYVRRLAAECPDRLLWGSDWPHATETAKPDDAALMDLLRRWLPDASARHAVLVRNPEALYGFEREAAGS